MLKLTQYCKTGSKVLADSKPVNPSWLRNPAMGNHYPGWEQDRYLRWTGAPEKGKMVVDYGFELREKGQLSQ